MHSNIGLIRTVTDVAMLPHPVNPNASLLGRVVVIAHHMMPQRVIDRCSRCSDCIINPQLDRELWQKGDCQVEQPAGAGAVLADQVCACSPCIPHPALHSYLRTRRQVVDTGRQGNLYLCPTCREA